MDQKFMHKNVWHTAVEGFGDSGVIYMSDDDKVVVLHSPIENDLR